MAARLEGVWGSSALLWGPFSHTHPEQGTELALSLSPSSLSPNATQRAEGQPLPSLPHLGHIFLTVSFKKNPKVCTFSRLGKQPKQPEPLPAFHPIPNPYKPLLPLFLFLLFFFLVYFFHYSLIPFRSAVSGKERRKGKSYILLHAANPYESSAPYKFIWNTLNSSPNLQYSGCLVFKFTPEPKKKKNNQTIFHFQSSDPSRSLEQQLMR